MNPDTQSTNSEAQRLDEAAKLYRTEAGELNRDITAYYDLQTILKHRGELGLSNAHAVMMGVGEGAAASGLAPHVAHLTVVEGSAALTKDFCKIAPENVNAVHSLFEAFTPAQPVDVAIATHVLEHVEHPVEVMRQAWQWLKVGGTAFVTVPHCGSLHRRIGVKMGLLQATNALNKQDITVGHRRVYSIPEFTADLRAAGFTIEKLGGFMIKLVSQAQMKGWPRELLDAIFEVSLEADAGLCSNLFAICRK